MASSLNASDKNAKATVKKYSTHSYNSQDGDEYGASHFGGFNQYFHNKKIKLQNKNAFIRETYGAEAPQLFAGLAVCVNGYTVPGLNDLNVMIVKHGGVFLQYMDGKTSVTHIIASSLTPKKKVEFAKYKVVKPQWVVDCIEQSVLLPWSDYRIVEEAPGQSLLGFGSQIPGRILSQRSRGQSSYKDDTRSVSSSILALSQFKAAPDGAPETAKEEEHSQEMLLNQDEDEFSFSSYQPTEDDEAPFPSAQLQRDRSEDFDFDEPDPELKEEEEWGVGKATMSEAPESTKEEVWDVNNDNTSDAPVIASEFETAPDPTTTADTRDFFSATRATSNSDPSPAKKLKMTAEENNAAILANPRLRSDTVVDPNFINKYYAESRLHHLSNWKAELKAHFLQLSQQATKPTPRLPNSRRYILHVDFDCFFAAVSSLTRPDLKDKPVGVGHSTGPSSEIASCNYAAREYGVKNGMWMKQATALCPQITIVQYDFPAYEVASKAFYDVILSLGARAVQSVSIDEALVDITNLCVSSFSAVGEEERLANTISTNVRDRIREKTGCDVSIGAGGNVLLAKLALRKAKPAGQYQLLPAEVLDFLAPLKCKDLPGVGHSIQGKIEEELKCNTVGELRELSIERLKGILGPKTGQKLHEYARGIDRLEVGEVAVRKSVSAEVNWGVRFETKEQAEEFMTSLASELHSRLSSQSFRGTNLTLKLMRRAKDAPLNPPKYMGHGACDTLNKTTVLGVPSNNEQLLGKEAILLLRLMNCPPAEIRGLGLMMTKLSLVDEGAPASQKKLAFGAKVKSESSSSAMTTEKKEEKPMFRMPKRQMPPMMSQFIVPTQVDESVLKSLPENMQARIAVEQDKKKASKVEPISRRAIVLPAHDLNVKPKPSHSSGLPSSSQLDPEVLNSLPDDLRAEILAEYAAAKGHQTLLPQSPRKNRILSTTSTRGKASPQKRRPGNLFSTGQGAITSFSRKLKEETAPSSGESTPTSSPPLGIDMSILSELPEDIREEVLAQARAEKQRLQSLKRVPSPRQSKPNPTAAKLQRRLQLPAKPPVPTIQGVSSLPEVRNLVTNWFNSCADEGPHADDVQDLVVWLKDVVTVERNVEKAVSVGRWFEWVVVEGSGDGEWVEAVEAAKLGIRTAAEERGMVELEV